MKSMGVAGDRPKKKKVEQNKNRITNQEPVSARTGFILWVVYPSERPEVFFCPRAESELVTRVPTR